MKLTIRDSQGREQGEFEVTLAIIENGKGSQALHDAIVATRAARRSGTACTKTMGEVAGSGKKPWRQKGTGRARAGSFASPLWRGGGVVFGPKPRDYTKKISKGTKQLALRKALSERLRAGDVILLNDLKLESAKTKEFIKFLAALGLSKTTLVVTHTADKNLSLAARNVQKVELTTGENLNSYQVLRSDKLVFTKAALEKVEQRLKGEVATA